MDREKEQFLSELVANHVYVNVTSLFNELANADIQLNGVSASELFFVENKYEDNKEEEFYEAYELWCVSEFLGNKLLELEEKVTDVCGLLIWSRCTTGQAIKLDGCIEQIWHERQKLMEVAK